MESIYYRHVLGFSIAEHYIWFLSNHCVNMLNSLQGRKPFTEAIDYNCFYNVHSNSRKMQTMAYKRFDETTDNCELCSFAFCKCSKRIVVRMQKVGERFVFACNLQAYFKRLWHEATRTSLAASWSITLKHSWLEVNEKLKRAAKVCVWIIIWPGNVHLDICLSSLGPCGGHIPNINAVHSSWNCESEFWKEIYFLKKKYIIFCLEQHNGVKVGGFNLDCKTRSSMWKIVGRMIVDSFAAKSYEIWLETAISSTS